eukprot:TRINITY_DN7461_c1_g1_i1.p1 TRINITY_DN7461_c1_g1~~TRINITY_DN7461_c1_g1_i1.p1  ORF type:complete len:221 (+),score=29.22 TRINITY_DN7461_c1_g1_i1:104-766(+)
MKYQFFVYMHCSDCVSSVTKALSSVEGVHDFSVDLENQDVFVEASCSCSTLLEALESTGRAVHVHGQGTIEAGSAVCQLDDGNRIRGVIWLSQISAEAAVIEASIAGLRPDTRYALQINEWGDISEGCSTTGPCYGALSPPLFDRLYIGEIGEFNVDSTGRGRLRKEDALLKVRDVIGRSGVVYELGSSGRQGVVAGIVARAAGVHQNQKKVCKCDSPAF